MFHITNTRPVTCRRCEKPIAPGMGAPVPENLPAFIGSPSRAYACGKCYQWMTDFIPAYQSACANYPAIRPHIAGLAEELVIIDRLGQPAEVHSQAAAWTILYTTIQSAGLLCESLSNKILDSLVVKRPRTLKDFTTLIQICKFTAR